jgi:hypothetical protein
MDAADARVEQVRWFGDAVGSDALEGSLDVFVGVAEGDGAAVGAGGGVFGLCEFG